MYWFDNMFYEQTFAWCLPKGKPKRYGDFFEFWFNYLSERCINIFKWKGLPFQQRFLELYLISLGYCGLAKLNNSTNSFDAVLCSMTGITNYATEFTTATATTPQTQTIFHIHGSPPSMEIVGNEGIIAVNNQTRTPLFPLIEYYANILAHIDLSIQKVCIKMRAQGLLKGTDDKAVKAITNWYKSIEKGDSIGVLDANVFGEMMQGIIAQPLGQSGTSELSELLTARAKYINSFWQDIGVNGAEEKRERLISTEITVGFNRVLFNVSDMLECRQATAEQVKEVFGDNVSVDINPKLKIDSVVSTQQESEVINESKE